MESFSSDNVSSSINAQLNFGTQNARNINAHIQTGKRVNSAKDDAAAFSISSKLSSELRQKTQRIQNLQNSLSFLQVQDGALDAAGKILIRMGELKTNYEAPTFNASDRAGYDQEFKELQTQLKTIRDQKFNGVSLFTKESENALLDKSQNPANLMATAGSSDGIITLNRANFVGSLKVEKPFAQENALIQANGSADEYRLAIDLKNHSGKLTWWQWPYGASDYFKAVHGSETIHEAAYGNDIINLNDGRSLTPVPGSGHGGSSGYPNSAWLNDPNRFDQNKDVIPFGQNGNASKTVELIVNESGRTSFTGWHMQYSIEYDPFTLDLLDDSVTWSLGDFDATDFDACLENLAGARAENGATQQRVTGEISALQSKIVSFEGHKERTEGLDIARAVGELNAIRTRLTINANLMKSAQEMENKLYTDFL